MANNKSNEEEDKVTKIENKLDNIINLFNKFMDTTINNELKTKKKT